MLNAVKESLKKIGRNYKKITPKIDRGIILVKKTI